MVEAASTLKKKERRIYAIAITRVRPVPTPSYMNKTKT